MDQTPLREQQETHQCRCVLAYPHREGFEQCEGRAQPDEAFCEGCEGRHQYSRPDMLVGAIDHLGQVHWEYQEA